MNSWDPIKDWERQAEVLRTAAPKHFEADQDEIACHREILEKARPLGNLIRPRLLILGATAALADLGTELGFNVVRTDINPAMFEVTSPHRRVQKTETEREVIADWRDLAEFPAGSFEAVCGDTALNNVALRDLPLVLAELKRVLVAGGVASLKQFVHPKPEESPLPRDLDEALQLHRAGRITDSEFRMVVRFWSFREHAYDAKTRVLDARRVFLTIDRARNEGTLTHAEHEKLTATRSRLRHLILTEREQIEVLRLLGEVHVHAASPRLHHRTLVRFFQVTRAMKRSLPAERAR